MTKFTFNISNITGSFQIRAGHTQGTSALLRSYLGDAVPCVVSHKEGTILRTYSFPWSQLTCPSLSYLIPQTEQKTGQLPCLRAPLGQSTPLSPRLPSRVKASHCRHHQELPPSSSCLFWPPKPKSGVLLFTVVAASPPILAAI